MLILRSPKGWTGPREVDGLQVEGTWRSHQVPVGSAREDKSHRAVLETWLRSYHPEELFDKVNQGLATSDETTSRVTALARALGKTPVEVNDAPGFVANRVLMPMINEAVYCLMEGVGTAESIDTVMKLGMNHPMGPLALADLIGLDTCLSIMEVLHSGIGEGKYRPCPLLRKYVDAGWLGRKAGRGFYKY